MKRIYNFKKGKKLIIEKEPLIMGILNGTPDSFSDGGKYNTTKSAISHLKKMEKEGADIVDVGVESTRPGHTQISTKEEIARMKEILLPVIDEAKVPISVDTYRAETADFALSSGADILNDIWGLTYDSEIPKVAAKYNVPVIIMHNKNTEEYEDIILEMERFFDRSINIALKNGIKKENIWLDPGIGFGKNVEQNIFVLKNLHILVRDDFPFLLAPSRKRFLGYLLDDAPFLNRDIGTLSACIDGYFKGANIFRVHNVKIHKEGFKVINSLRGDNNG